MCNERESDNKEKRTKTCNAVIMNVLKKQENKKQRAIECVETMIINCFQCLVESRLGNILSLFDPEIFLTFQNGD